PLCLQAFAIEISMEKLLLLATLLHAVSPQLQFPVEKPPNIYKWITENAYLCSSVSMNDGSVVTFMDEKEGLNCSLCPETPPTQIPRTACAIE
ncbi:hypothetical protein PENTCL1PPCAC_29526, partial [Pristionchus entomophagus]